MRASISAMLIRASSSRQRLFKSAKMPSMTSAIPHAIRQSISWLPLCQVDSTKCVLKASATVRRLTSAASAANRYPPTLPSRVDTRPARLSGTITLRTRAAFVQIFSASASLETVSALWFKYTSACTATMKSLFIPTPKIERADRGRPALVCCTYLYSSSVLVFNTVYKSTHEQTRRRLAPMTSSANAYARFAPRSRWRRGCFCACLEADRFAPDRKPPAPLPCKDSARESLSQRSKPTGAPTQ